MSRVQGEAATRQALEEDGAKKWSAVLAIGKAASSMMLGAVDALDKDGRALVLTKYHHLDGALERDPRITTIESGHPVPDQRSLDAGRAAIDFVEGLGRQDELLVLVSGGASALVESLVPGFNLDRLISLTDCLLAEGYSIDQMNVLRTRISTVKGGQLLRRFRGRRIQVYAISDIPGDDQDLIGSGIGGITSPQTAPFALSSRLESLLSVAAERKAQEDGDPGFLFDLRLVATNGLAREAAAQEAAALGLSVIESGENLVGEVGALAESLAERLTNAIPGVYLWGGEPTVVLPERPGSGGRNQSLAVALALETRRLKDRVVYAAVAGTDGTDGPTDAAGGVVYPGLDPAGAEQALAAANAEPWLRQANRLLVTGPTGTNVMDLAVVIVEPDNQQD